MTKQQHQNKQKLFKKKKQKQISSHGTKLIFSLQNNLMLELTQINFYLSSNLTPCHLYQILSVACDKI